MRNFKVGDKVSCFYDDSGDTGYIGKEGFVTRILDTQDTHYIYTSFAECSRFGEHEIKLITNKTIMSTIIEKIKLLKKGEPEKSNILAGLRTSNDEFTSEGKEAFLEFLYQTGSNAQDFSTAFAKPILEERDENK